jgi:hypothetical protein
MYFSASAPTSLSAPCWTSVTRTHFGSTASTRSAPPVAVSSSIFTLISFYHGGATLAPPETN